MASSTQARWQHLIKKGNQSGFDIVKIILADLWEGEQGRDSILNDAERDALVKKNLNENRKNLFDWIETFKGILYFENLAKRFSLEVQVSLFKIESILERYRIHAVVDMELKILNHLTPEIVTEKQLADLKARQRDELFKEKTSLIYIIIQRAEKLLVEICSDPADINLEFMITEGSSKEISQAVIYFKKACSEIHDLIKTGKLSVSYKKNAMGVLQRIQGKKAPDEIAGLYQIACYIEPEEKFDTVKPEPFLGKCQATGEALYKIGLPEWVEWIDEYKHNYTGSAPYSVAVIQNPSGSCLDERGYYKTRNKFQNPFFALPEDTIFKDTPATPEEFIEGKINNAKEWIKFYYFIRCLLSIFKDMTGVNFCEGFECGYDLRLENSWESLSLILEHTMSLSTQAKKTMENRQGFEDLENFKPSSVLKSLFEKRLSEYPLGYTDWFFDCRDFFLKEEFKTMPEDEIEFLLSQASKSRKKELMELLKQAHEGRGVDAAL